ncbi:hypothetical protein J1C56_02380 [Aminobacter anthyllidis]|uniref:Uncharacterized protein n=2 Tax=Aminobacter anthyllidis TaxID=1035067 RepID=A0A9X1A6V4_9HYPH|nr:hypothetical protein [Aminobacter anthyllidis]MBT1154431.1 hypothetical protein [Aminobacter anthyllidis]
MASMLYYGLAETTVSDGEFDEWCKRLAAEWDDLEPIRQWQLGSPAEIAASGFQIKVTTAAAEAAIRHLRSVRPGLPPVVMTRGDGWRWGEEHRVRYLNTYEFMFDPR